MGEIPDFWRPEIYHPLSVHLPIGLLLAATAFKFISLFKSASVWKQGGSVLLFMGVVGAWISVYTGDVADGIVSRELCDPIVLKNHENASIAMAWIFTVTVVLEMINTFLRKYGLKLAVVVSMLVGSGFLVYTGHLGATLVYQQAAGVYVPSNDCSEFE